MTRGSFSSGFSSAGTGLTSSGSTVSLSTPINAGSLPALNQLTAPTGDLNLNTHKLLNVLNGTSATDVATFGQTTKVYNNGTIQSASKIFTGTTTTDSSGAFSFNLTPATFTAIFSFNVVVLSTGLTAADLGFASVNVASNTVLSGAGFQGVGAVLSALPFALLPAGRTVYATVFGI